jgi:hypothetical protein
MVEFEDEKLADARETAMDSATKQLERFKFNKEDLPLSFSLIESRMAAGGIRKQWSKFMILQTCLPMEYITEVRSIVIKKEAEFTDRLPYKALKTEIMRIFGPKMETGCERALKRTLTGKPSQLARTIINDIGGCQRCMVHGLPHGRLPHSTLNPGSAALPFATFHPEPRVCRMAACHIPP